METFTFYLSFGDKKMRTKITAENYKEAESKMRAMLKVDKVAKDKIMEEINETFAYFGGMFCSNPLHKYEVNAKGICSKCKGKL